jgi:hypothetical protein
MTTFLGYWSLQSFPNSQAGDGEWRDQQGPTSCKRFSQDHQVFGGPHGQPELALPSSDLKAQIAADPFSG